MSLDIWLRAVGGDGRARLRWKVIRELGILPGSRQDRRLSDRDIIFIGLNLLLDKTDKYRTVEQNVNPAFDEIKYEQLSDVK
jgi:hypothetical protein